MTPKTIEYSFSQYYKDGTPVNDKIIISNYEFLDFIYHDTRLGHNFDFDSFLVDLYEKGTNTIVGRSSYIIVDIVINEVIE